MKKIEFVKVDAKDGRPTTEVPARHGPADPMPGLNILWWEGRAPVHYYATVDAEADTDVPGVLREISESDWDDLVEDWRAATIARLADVRFNSETAGVELPDGSQIRTDRESQAQVNAAYATLRDGFVSAADFKGANGWMDITLDEVTPIAEAVARHVQPCFTAERRVSDQVAAAATAEDLVGINLVDEFEAELEAVKSEQASA